MAQFAAESDLALAGAIAALGILNIARAQHAAPVENDEVLRKASAPADPPMLLAFELDGNGELPNAAPAPPNRFAPPPEPAH